jgi:hypothetical protein
MDEAVLPVPRTKVLWIQPESNTNAYEHKIDGECDCELCKLKPRLILVVQ